MLALSLCVLTPLLMAKELVLSTWMQEPSSYNRSAYVHAVLKEAFSRANIKISIVNKPAERSLRDSNNGLSDGEFVRVKGIQKLYKNLVLVPEEILTYNLVAFSKEEHFDIKNWQSLQQYNVGIILGWKILEEKVQTKKKRYAFAEAKRLFELLENKRVDLVIYSKHLGESLAKKQGYQNIFALEPTLAVKKAYLYLHKKHKNLVPILTKHLKNMAQDGTLMHLKTKHLRVTK